MIEFYLVVGAIAFAFWLGWCAGLQHAEDRMRRAESLAHINGIAREWQRQGDEGDLARDLVKRPALAPAPAPSQDEALLVPSTRLAALIGPDPITPTDAYKKVMLYAEANDLRMASDGYMGFDGPMRLAFVTPQASAAGLAALVRGQLSAPNEQATVKSASVRADS